MAKEQVNISEAEMEILQVLWEHGPITARQVLEKTPKGRNPAYSTIITLLQRMEAKGVVRHTRSDKGKAFVFHAEIKPEQVRKNAVRSLLKRYFQDDPLTVFSTLVRTQKLNAEEIQKLRAMLDELES